MSSHLGNAQTLPAQPLLLQHCPCPTVPREAGDKQDSLSQASLFPLCGSYGSDLSSLFGWSKNPSLKNQSPESFGKTSSLSVLMEASAGGIWGPCRWLLTPRLLAGGWMNPE